MFYTPITAYITHILPRNVILDQLMLFFSLWHGYAWVWFLALGIFLLEENTVRRSILIGAVVVAALFSFLACEGIKHLVQAERPCQKATQSGSDSVLTQYHVYCLTSYSFPSGHATVAFAIAVVLIMMLGQYAPWWLGIAAMVAFSRVYLGAHYVEDVVVGGMLGSLIGYGIGYIGDRMKVKNGTPWYTQ